MVCQVRVGDPLAKLQIFIDYLRQKCFGVNYHRGMQTATKPSDSILLLQV